MSETKKPGVAVLRGALKELKTATSRELAAHCGVPAEPHHQFMAIAGQISSTMCTVSLQEDVWCERVGMDGRQVIWGYQSAPERAQVAPPKAPETREQLTPKSEPWSAGAQGVAAGLELLFEQLARRFPAATPPAPPTDLTPILERLAKIEIAVGHLLALWRPKDDPQVAPLAPLGAAPRLPRVLIYRVDKHAANELRLASLGKLDLTVHHDLSGNVKDAQRYAAKTWDHVVLVTPKIGHGERAVLKPVARQLHDCQTLDQVRLTVAAIADGRFASG